MNQRVWLGQTAKTLWRTQWVEQLLCERRGPGLHCPVSLRETIGRDPGCEGPATELRVVLLDFREIRATPHKSASEIGAADIAAVL